MSEHLLAITDSACTKSVAGTTWLQKYVDVLKSFQIELPLLPEVDNFKFGASRVYASNYAVVVSFQVGGTWILVKVSIIHGDLPLLLSRTVLAELGMVYNIKEHVADFATVNVCGHPLLFTPTGHPAISVHPGGKGIPPHARPDKWEPDQSSRGEVQILSDATAYIACCSSGRGGIQEVCVANNAVPCSVDQREARYPQIFYAKRIPLEVKNLLVSENIHVDTFIKWWTQTSIMSDFWVETPSTLVRVHVIPRKSLFSPKEWRTSQTLLRDNLLRVLGSLRETFSVSCRSQRGLPVAVDLWESNDQKNCHQCLWVGRTVFNRRPIAPIRQLPVPAGHVVQGTMADDEDRASVRGQPSRAGTFSAVDRGGAEERDRGSKEGPQRGHDGAQGDERYEARGAEGGGGPHRSDVCERGDPRNLDAAHPGLPRDAGQHSDEHREIPGQRVLSGAVVVRTVGGPGGTRERGQHEPGPEAVRALVSEEEGKGGDWKWTDPRGDDAGAREVRQGTLPRGIGNKPIVGECDGDERSGQAAATLHPGVVGSEKHGIILNVGEKDGGEAQHEGADVRGTRPQRVGRDSGLGAAPGTPQGQGGTSVTDRTINGERDDYNPDPYDTAGYQESKPEDPTENVDYKNNVENKHVENHFDYQRDDYNLSDATGEDELSFDDYDAEVLLTECTEDAIHNAIKSNDYTPQRLLHLLQEVFGKDGEHFPRRGARKRTRAFGAGDLGENRIVLGYYTYGSMRGICNNSSKYASLSIYIKNYFLSRSADAKWSSLSISLNSASRVHSDHNNLKGTGNYITTVGDYTNGGGIWTENKDGNYDQRFLDGKGNKVKGIIQDTYGKVVEFVADRLHCPEPWHSGHRWSITGFTTRGLAGSTQKERKQLRQWGYPLHDLRLLGTMRRQHEINLPPTTGNANYRGTTTSSTTRPKRSTRKSLWRTATRVSTFMAWSLSAMLSFSNPTTVEANDYKIGKDTALLEIGGMTQTLDATTVFERITGEPLLWPDIPTNHAGSYVLKYILELNPRMLWLHPPTGYTGEDERKFFEVLDICGRWQVEQQRALVVSVDGADPDLLQRLQKQLSAYGDVSYSILGEENIFRVHRTEPKQAYVAEGGIGEIGDSPEDIREGAAGITFDKGVAADTAAALRRLHQNLGHPAREDLVRHLRLAGADNEVIKAAKGMACSTCARTKRPKSARPSSEPKLLEFGDVVGVDMMYAYDMNGKKIKLFSIVDHASSYQVVIKVPNQTGKTLEQVFLKQWIQIFGAPKAISLDLERGIQDAFGRIADWFHIELHTSAGQAHWQSGYTERHGKWWKEIFDRVVQDQSVGGDEIEEAVAATSSAKNNLRRKCGWAPSQIVFGKLPRDDEDLKGEVEDGGGGSILRSPDEAQHRREIIRNAARIAFYKTRTEEKIRRGLSQRARIKPRDLENGATVFFWRKPASKKYGIWKGPGVVIGRQHENYWISHGGRCYLCAPEHLRCALPEELGGLFALRATKDDLLRLVDQSYDDVGVFAEDEGEDMEEYAPSFVDEGEAPMELDNIDLENGDGEDTRPTPLRRAAEGELPRESVRRRYSTKRPPGGSSDPPRREDTHHEAMILKRATTRRGKEKQLEKEIPWSMIPESKRPLFIEAERKQWQEHLHLQALRPLSVEESRGLKHSDRVLTSRFAYRDKNLAKRRLNPEVEWKPKSRLVVSGQTDPDIMSGALRTDSPTVSRTAVMALLQIAASRQDSGWGVSAGDVTAAFLNGEKLDRELYLRQPKHGLPGLHPEQLIKVEKGIFGLIDSPRKWWKKFKKDVQEIVFKLDDGKRAKFYASPLDPCVFQLIEIDNEDNKTEQAPSCYAAVHVDDILLVCDKKVRDLIQHQLSECFPVEEWENDTFDFIGSHIGTKSDGIFLSQANYTASRLFEIDIDPKATNDEPGTAEQTADNRSLVGALSWLASQSRPDLSCGVSMCQQLQARPTIGDLRFSNLMAKRALSHKEEGILLTKVPLDKMIIVVYHDAGWSNAPDSNEDPIYYLYPEDEEAGLMTEGPWCDKTRKTKKKNSAVASQLGALVMMTSRDALCAEGAPASILEWRSHACDRVCRSTFSAETMGCIEGVELGQYVRAMIASLLTGSISREIGKDIPLVAVTDCRSLFDHMHKDGLPRTPSDRRLAIDIACLRQSLADEKPAEEDAQVPLLWVPTHLQRADVLTKPKKATGWWPETGHLGIPLKEGKVVLKQCKSEVR